jgi:hypothetical protein
MCIGRAFSVPIGTETRYGRRDTWVILAVMLILATMTAPSGAIAPRSFSLVLLFLVIFLTPISFVWTFPRNHPRFFPVTMSVALTFILQVICGLIPTEHHPDLLAGIVTITYDLRFPALLIWPGEIEFGFRIKVVTCIS